MFAITDVLSAPTKSVTKSIVADALVYQIQTQPTIEIQLDWDNQDGDYNEAHIIELSNGASLDFNITCKGELWGEGFEIESVVFDPEIEELHLWDQDANEIEIIDIEWGQITSAIKTLIIAS